MRRQMAFFCFRSYTFVSTILFLILIFPQYFSSSPPPPPSLPTVYDVLSDYNFPMGLLPEGVLGYELHPETGEFLAFLNGSCIFTVEKSYLLRYNPIIKGYISRGKLARLEGVSVKLLFIWVDIVEVSRNGDDIVFSVGIAGASFPISNFEECPQCRRGLHCGGDSEKLGKA